MRAVAASAGRGPMSSLCSFPKEETELRRMETSSFQFESLYIVSSAEIALLVENGGGFPFHSQLLHSL